MSAGKIDVNEFGEIRFGDGRRALDRDLHVDVELADDLVEGDVVMRLASRIVRKSEVDCTHNGRRRYGEASMRPSMKSAKTVNTSTN